MTFQPPTAYHGAACARRLTTAALIPAAIVCAFAFAVPQDAGARARKANCNPSTTHAFRGAHTCSTGHGAGRSNRGRPSHGHAKRATRHHGNGAGGKPSSGKATTEASCANGADATASGDGFACADGSEPGCATGFAAVIADDGSTMLCEREAAQGKEPEEEEESVEEEGSAEED